MRIIVKLKPNDIDVPTKAWRHALAEMSTKIIPPQEYDFFEKNDYFKGPSAVYFFKYPERNERTLYEQLETLADDCDRTIRITVITYLAEFSTDGKG